VVRPHSTTRVDFALPASALEVQEVLVVADRPAVMKSTTNAVSIRGGRTSELSSPPEEPVQFMTATLSKAVTSASFEIPGASTIPSDNEEHRVTVLVVPLSAQFSHTAVPRMLEDVFLRASMKNSTDFPLLTGKASVYLDNSFVASSVVPSVLPGESFDTFLGSDNNISVERKLLNRTTETGGLFSRSTKVTYDILLSASNKKKSSDKITVSESIPLSKDENVNITLITPAPGTQSPDENGVLRWEWHLGPGERREAKVRYTVEFPATMPIEGLE
jgi:uncharacterized protein (TIGR02231 family)